MASDISEKCHFHNYSLNKLKDGAILEDYTLQDIFKDLLSAEAHLEVTRKAFDIAKDQLTMLMTSKIMEQFK